VSRRCRRREKYWSRRGFDARTRLLDEAEKAIDAFLTSSPADEMAIAAFTQKGNLLVERGRISLALAQRPGANAATLSTEAVAFFDRAIKTLRTAVPAAAQGDDKGDGKQPPPQPVVPDRIETAEDAVLRSLLDTNREIEEIRLPIKDVREAYDAKKAENAPFQAKLDEIDKQIRALQVEIPPIQADLQNATARPDPRQRPPTPREVQGRKEEASRLMGQLQNIAARVAAAEASKQEPLNEMKKIAFQLNKLKRDLEAAEKPLERELADPLNRQEVLRTKLLQTRLMVAETYFEKSKACATASTEWKAALEESRRLNHDLAEKYGVGWCTVDAVVKRQTWKHVV
jgi:predicted  nucleic acid-binding Zn-ribbon protein